MSVAHNIPGDLSPLSQYLIAFNITEIALILYKLSCNFVTNQFAGN